MRAATKAVTIRPVRTQGCYSSSMKSPSRKSRTPTTHFEMVPLTVVAKLASLDVPLLPSRPHEPASGKRVSDSPKPRKRLNMSHPHSGRAKSSAVLVVDDHADNRELLAEYLQFVGCTVATASNGAEALAKAEAMRPQVILMDLGLPGIMDGGETTRRIRSHPLLREAVMIAVTAHGFPADVQRAMHAGCRAVVIKPYDVEALAEQVKQVVAQRQRSSLSAPRPMPTPPTVCPRCRRTDIEEEETSGSSLKWLVCRFCGHHWSVTPRRR